MIDLLLRALIESGADAGPEELAEILWLAIRIGAVDRQANTTTGIKQSDANEQLAHPRAGIEVGSLEAVGGDDYYYAMPRNEATAAVQGSRRGEGVLVRRAMALQNPLGLMRALRPLSSRTVPGSTRTELDEERSVASSVEQGMVVPILKPQRGRWLDLAIVLDSHHSMLLWHDLVAELCSAITQTGIFRDVRLWFLSGTDAGATPTVATSKDGAPRHPQEVADPSGHRLVLVVTDTVAEGWNGPGVETVLRHWATHNPVALVNVLPRRLWSRCAVTPSGVLVRAGRPAASNVSWRVALPQRRNMRANPKFTGQTRSRLADRIAIPIVEASPVGLGALASLVAGKGRWSRMSCFTVSRGGTTSEVLAAQEPAASADLDAMQALRRFRESASPIAQELAGYLSAVPLTLPVMTLVRRAMVPHSEHGHLAEVALGGLFTQWHGRSRTGDMARFEFDFIPGVRDALLGSQLRHDITAVQELVRREVGKYVKGRSGAPSSDFPATRATTDETGDRPIAPAALPFAQSAAIPGTMGGSSRARRQSPRSHSSFRIPAGAMAMASVSGADGRSLLATYSPDGTIRIWDPRDGSLAREPFMVRAPGTVAIAALPQRGRSTHLATISVDGMVRLWDSNDGALSGTGFTINQRDVLAMTEFSSIERGLLLATTGYGGGVRLWDAAAGGSQVGREYHIGTFPGRALTFLMDTRNRPYLATADYSGEVLLWDLESRDFGPRRLMAIRPPEILAMASIDRAKRSSLLATIGYDSVVRIWDPFAQFPSTRSRFHDYLSAMNPLEFESLIIRLFEAMDVGRITTAGGGRAGIDVILTNRETGEVSIVQAKYVQRAVPTEELQMLARAMGDLRASRGILVTNGVFSRPNFELAKDLERIELIDGEKLWELVQEYLASEISSDGFPIAQRRETSDDY
ncbi:SAV_2336 N-terminal domain-related protein [Streptacidiphilus fuscans]|uniref:Restriction endonuclease n=1 Tax=Streptacidiphilus fuscans TaxID=2789292 RepID=A0A931B6B2_9ACTN|nr:SAV_2336 N-terminal domain-related protein [Streptacidiphilus fuscans]MBF9071909.1 restriction endonuclease [Streptacidiphilus fuscans]